MIFETFRQAIQNVWSNKLRTFLTMLGIIIGVTALVTLVSLVNGATGAITSQVESLGNDMLMVTVMDDKSAPLRLENLEEISRLDGVRQASPSGSMNARAKRGSTETSVSVYGVLPAYADIQGLELDRGRFLKTADVDNRSYVAVLSHDLHETLFGDEDGLDQFITVGGRSFRFCDRVRRLLRGLLCGLIVRRGRAHAAQPHDERQDQHQAEPSLFLHVLLLLWLEYYVYQKSTIFALYFQRFSPVLSKY